MQRQDRKLPASFNQLVNLLWMLGLLVVGGFATASAFNPLAQEDQKGVQWPYIAVPESVNTFGEDLLAGRVGEAFGRLPALVNEYMQAIEAGDATAIALLILVLGGVLAGGLLVTGFVVSFGLRWLEGEIKANKATFKG